MDLQYIPELVEEMRYWGIKFDKGLSENELQQIEEEENFHFPDDLRLLLTCALPVWEPKYSNENGFPNWRDNASMIMNKSKNYLFEGLEYAIEFGFEAEELGYWNKKWGDKLTKVSDVVPFLRQKLETAPLLIPVYGHRFIPSVPVTAGNPVLSVAGVDIIHYGSDLIDYFHQEFDPKRSQRIAFIARPRPVEFWDEFIYGT